MEAFIGGLDQIYIDTPYTAQAISGCKCKCNNLISQWHALQIHCIIRYLILSGYSVVTFDKSNIKVSDPKKLRNLAVTQIVVKAETQGSKAIPGIIYVRAKFYQARRKRPLGHS